MVGTAQCRGAELCRVVVVVSGHDRDCWFALGAAHATFPPVAGRLRDYIAAPKHNLYRSLHTTVFGPDNEQVDVLIRTKQMAEEAEDGIAAAPREASHAAGHEAAGEQARKRTDLAWLQRLLAWHHGDEVSEDYLTELRSDLRAGSTVVSSVADGQLVTLPVDASGIDFAFDPAVGVGSRLVGLQINNRPATVTATLRTGDRVEALTGPPGKVPPTWLASVHSPRARKALTALLDLQQQNPDLQRRSCTVGQFVGCAAAGIGATTTRRALSILCCT